MEQSLDDLKQAVQEETETETKAEEVIEDEQEIEDTEEDTPIETEEVAELEADESDSVESEEVKEPWMQESEKKFTDNDIAAAKRKLKGRLSDRDEEIADLKSQLAAQSPINEPPKGKPTREQFYDSEDPDDAYVEAMTDWKIANKAQSIQQEQKRQQFDTMISQSVTDHYERANKLITTAGISEEIYQNADANVRGMINRITNGAGNAITDNLINVLGEGSEKVLFYVGRNAAALSELQSLMTSDPSGLKAVSYLSRKAAELNTPVKRASNAKPPAKQLDGDESTGTNIRSFKKAYDKANKSGDVQGAFDARRKAKQAKQDVSSW